MCLGIDIHKQYVQVAVLDEDSEIDREVCVENVTLDETAQQYWLQRRNRSNQQLLHDLRRP